MRKFLAWLDDNIIFLLSGFLLAFIPLYPKFPLFDALPGYIVRIRLEDLFITITLFVWVVQLLRRKVTFGHNPLTKPIAIYLSIGVLSMLSAMFITHTVPFQSLHIGKMVLHFLRRVEYFSLFFVFFSSVKSIKHVKIYLGILIATVIAVTIYGYGQKYIYWPAFSTMNREFSKGWKLYLTEHARVLSTFGGHYDLAAYIMVALVIFWGIFFALKNIFAKLGIFLVIAGSFWLLILTASRTSFIAYLGGLFVLFFLWMFKKGIKWSITRYIAVTFLSIVIMLSFGDLSERFTKILKIDRRVEGFKSLLFKPFGKVPTDKAIFLENNLAAVTSKSDEPPTPIKPKRPSDVYEDIPEGVVATESGGIASFAAVPRTYSKAALIYDLSTGIRLDALWPQAIRGFLRNPLLGTGYSTLNKANVEDFTEAESTDNDFLRALGETGILGFLSFYGIIIVTFFVIFRSFARVKDTMFTAFLMGFAAAIFGLLINALYIDVFEASKIAFPFWATTGIVLGGIKVLGKDFAKEGKFPRLKEFQNFSDFWSKIVRLLKRFVRSDAFPLIILLAIALVVRFHRIDEPLADWHSWRQADTSAVTRNFVRHGINVLYPTYNDLSSLQSGLDNPRGLRMVEFPIYNVFATVVDKVGAGSTVDFSGRFTSILMSLGTLVFIYFLTKKYTDKLTAVFAAFFWAALPYNIYYSRVILPEPTMVFFSTGLVYFFTQWIEREKWRFYLLSAVFSVATLLIKPAGLFVVPALIYVVWRKWRFSAIKKPSLYLLAAVTIAPFVWWRWWVLHFPEGVPAYTWLLNGDGIRFKGAFFWWLFGQRIGKLILGFWGLPLLLFGVLIRPNKREGWFFHWWIVGMLLYLSVFATGNVRHDYYQAILIPIIVIFLAKGSSVLVNGAKELFSIWISRGLFVICMLFMLAFGWYQVRDFFNINHPEIVEAGREFDRIIDKDNITVIAPYEGDTAFLYQTGRNGWPIVEGTIDDMIAKGAHFYISVKMDQLTQDLIKEAIDPKGSPRGITMTKQTPYFVIIQLVPNQKLPQ